MVHGKIKNFPPHILKRRLKRLLEEHPGQLFRAFRDEVNRDPSISARFLAYLLYQTTSFIPAEPDYENTGEHLGLLMLPSSPQFTLTLHKKPEIDSLNFKQLFLKPQETVSNLV